MACAGTLARGTSLDTFQSPLLCPFMQREYRWWAVRVNANEGFHRQPANAFTLAEDSNGKPLAKTLPSEPHRDGSKNRSRIPLLNLKLEVALCRYDHLEVASPTHAPVRFRIDLFLGSYARQSVV